jgi:HEAT repeat protein
MRNLKLCAVLMAAGLGLSAPRIASAGVGGSSDLIEAAASSGSVDAIVAELERAEYIPTSGAIPTVIKLIDSPSSRVREAAGWWLGRRAVRSQVIALAQLRLVGGQDPVAAGNVLDALRGMRDVTTLGLVMGYLAHPLDETSGVAGLQAVAAIGDPAGLTGIGSAIGSSLAGVRAEALRTVRGLRAPVGQQVITTGAAYIPLLKDSDATVRREAALTLGFLGQGGLNAASSGVTNLIAALTDSAVPVRRASAWALGEIGNSSASAALTTALNDSDASVRSIAKAALGRLK